MPTPAQQQDQVLPNANIFAGEEKEPGEWRAEGISKPGQSPLLPIVIFPQGFIPPASSPEQQPSVVRPGWQQGQGISLGNLQAIRAGAQHSTLCSQRWSIP